MINKFVGKADTLIHIKIISKTLVTTVGLFKKGF